ncbi:site-2 protease family protein [Actinomyces israelii]|uniref:Site-2 protease family protein n=1 Tax=Actinomyces israelii TaxID=1659 RepID=A0ABT4I461_9ACTO|nr:site-2 protease family protein [Actinomyces israelii]MCZ0856525.1 site-2 protease family protein [Actinomyces israelii]
MSSASTPQGWVLGRIGAAPVVVSPTSLLLGLLIAGSWYPLVASTLPGSGLVTVLATVVGTVAGVGASILIHELSHGLAGTLLGRRPVHYELYLWGGRTSFGPARAWAPWKDVITSLAGPAANLALWAAGDALLRGGAVTSIPVGVVVLALTWVNLALAIFNALPGLPLDGGHALASLVTQVTGRRQAGERVAAAGGLVVVAAIAWRWVLEPLALRGSRPDSFSLILAVMVAWPIVSTSWRVLGLGRGERAAARVDLRPLMRPVATLPASATIAQVRFALSEGAAVVLVADGPAPLGVIDDAALDELALPEQPAVTAGEICTVLPTAAVSSELTGRAAADALKRARTLSRWLIVVEGGRMAGAVPTGAR